MGRRKQTQLKLLELKKNYALVTPYDMGSQQG